MDDFTFHRPGTVAEAQEAIRGTDDGKFLAGGQSLLPIMKLLPMVFLSMHGGKIQSMSKYSDWAAKRYSPGTGFASVSLNVSTGADSRNNASSIAINTALSGKSLSGTR